MWSGTIDSLVKWKCCVIVKRQLCLRSAGFDVGVCEGGQKSTRTKIRWRRNTSEQKSEPCIRFVSSIEKTCITVIPCEKRHKIQHRRIHVVQVWNGK